MFHPPSSILARAAVLYLCVSVCGSSLFAQAPQLVSVKKIWDAAPHSAFTDLKRFHDQWFCTFREATGHVGGNGKIRVLTSDDGELWVSAALLSEAGIDLRDPKLCLTPDGRLMLVMGGSVYEGSVLKGRQPRVAFSPDGRQWTPPQRVLGKGDWLWRVTWHNGRAYGITYSHQGSKSPTNEWSVTLVTASDGVAWRPIARLAVPGHPCEATIRFLRNNEGVILVRRGGSAADPDNNAWIGHSQPPYTNWRWHPAGMQVGGPNFLVLADGAMIASGRQYNARPTGPKTFVGPMTLESVKAELILPSGGDCSYPGMVWHDGLLWLSYYSSHEGRTSIYLARIRLPSLREGERPRKP